MESGARRAVIGGQKPEADPPGCQRCNGRAAEVSRHLAPGGRERVYTLPRARTSMRHHSAGQQCRALIRLSPSFEL